MNSNVSIFNSEELSMMSFLELLNLKDKFQTLKKNLTDDEDFNLKAHI